MCPDYSQVWNILVPQRREYYTPTELAPADSWYLSGRTISFWAKLARPAYACRSPSNASRTTATGETRLSTLESLPVEVLAMILDDSALSKQDIIALGLSSKHLWQQTLLHIRHSRRTQAPRWAGMELACVGSYLRSLPKAFEDYAHMFNFKVRYDTLSSDITASNFCSDWYWTTLREFAQPPSQTAELQWMEALKAESEKIRKLSPSYERDIVSIFAEPSFDDPKLTWVLRNMTTREYFTCGCVSGTRTAPPEGYKGPPVEFLNPEDSLSSNARQGYVVSNGHLLPTLPIEEVLLERIQWGGFSPGTAPKRSSWAGHAFDIVALGSSDFPDADGWQDITTDVVQLKQQGFCNKPPRIGRDTSRRDELSIVPTVNRGMRSSFQRLKTGVTKVLKGRSVPKA